jgi:2'-5' RNA ligase
MPRLFTALEIPREAALSLSLLRGGLPGARWLSVENYHITLRFIGDVDGPTADELIGAFDRIDRQAFSLTLSGMGSFGSKKPHSIWAGVSRLRRAQGAAGRDRTDLSAPWPAAGSAPVFAARDARTAAQCPGRSGRQLSRRPW